MITSLGKFLRKLRIDNNEILADMAKKLEVSSAFLSAVENGKKRIPRGWAKVICALYRLDDEQAEKLDQVIAETEKVYELDFTNVSKQNRELAVSFARRFDEINDEQRAEIRKILEDIK